jgi:hypothetical protein
MGCQKNWKASNWTFEGMLGLALSTKVLRSEKFLEKVGKLYTYHFC